MSNFLIQNRFKSGRLADFLNKRKYNQNKDKYNRAGYQNRRVLLNDRNFASHESVVSKIEL